MGKRTKEEKFDFDSLGGELIQDESFDFNSLGGELIEEPVKKKGQAGSVGSSTTGQATSQSPSVIPRPTPEMLQQAGFDMAMSNNEYAQKDLSITPERAKAFTQIVDAGKARKLAYSGPQVPEGPYQKRADQMAADKDVAEAQQTLKNLGMAPSTDAEAARRLMEEIEHGVDTSELQQISDDPLMAVNQMTSSFNKAVIGTAASIPKSIAILAKPLDTFFGIQDKATEEYGTYKAGQWLEDKAVEWGVTATDPDRDQSFWQTAIPSALGSVVAIVLSGGRSGFAAGSTLETAAATQAAAIKRGVTEAGESLLSRSSAVGSMAMAVPEFDAAKAAGASDEEALDVWAKNYFVGATEILPIQNALSRINKASGGALVQIVKNGLAGGFEEGIQETVQQMLTNKIADGSYDPGRDLYEDVLQGAGAGFFVGFLLPGIGAAMQNMDPETRKITQSTLNDMLKRYKVAGTPTPVNPVGPDAPTPAENATNKVVNEMPVEQELPITPGDIPQVPNIEEPVATGEIVAPEAQPEAVEASVVPETAAVQPAEESFDEDEAFKALGFTEDIPEEVAEEPVAPEAVAETPIAEETPAPAEEPTVEESVPDQTNQEVEFSWLGTDMKGTVTKVTDDGRYKIKGENGNNYTVEAADVKIQAAPVEKPKKVKNPVQKLDKQVQRMRQDIEANTTDFKVQGNKLTIVTDKGAEIFKKYKALEKQRNEAKDRTYYGEQASTEKHYEQPIGAPKKTQSIGRIKPAPIYGGKPKLLKDIVLDFAKSKPGTIYYTKTPSKGRRALGAYSPSMGTTAIKYRGDLDTVAHEAGHELDDRYGILEAIPGAQQTAIEKELTDLSQYGSKAPKGHPNAKKYRLGEGMAEYIRAYLVNPDQAASKYPDTTAWIKQAVPADVLAKFEAFGNDIRNYSGLTAHDQVMSNVQFEPGKKKGSILEFFQPKSVSEDGFKITWLDRLSQKFLTRSTYFDKAVKFLETAQGTKLNPSQNPSMLASLYLGSNEKVDNIFERGLVNGRNQRVLDPKTKKHMTIEWLLQPFDNTSSQSVLKEMQETISYMIAERTNELADRFGREDVITGIGAGLYSDTNVAQRRLEEFAAEPQDKQDRIKEAARRYREYANHVLEYMVEKGRLSQEQYNQITESNLQYVALNRVLEPAPGEEIAVFQSGSGNAVGSTKNVLKKIKGSTQLIKNPYESLADFTIKGVKEADRNEVMQAFSDLFRIPRTMYQGDPVYNSVARPATAGDANTVQVFVNGEPEYWQLQEDVYKSVKKITEAAWKLPWFMTALSKLIRAAVTNFPVFAIRNRIRDIQHRMIVSNTGSWSGYDIYKSKKTKELTKDMFQLFGGGQAGYHLMNDDFYSKKMKEAVAEVAGDKRSILTSPKRWLEGYDKLLSAGERATRLEEYRSAYKDGISKGMSEYDASIYAAYKARDLLDFAVAGEVMQVVNQVIPFSNAAVQGLRKTTQAAYNDPGGFALRFLLYAVIPALFNRLLVSYLGADEEYEELPNYRRDLFYNIPINDGLWVAIPKPFELGVLSSGSERFLSKFALDQEDALDGYYRSVAHSVMPVDEAWLVGGFKPFVEVMANYDFFREKTIIPPEDVGLKVEYRDTSKASRLGLAIQSAIGVDGRQADYVTKATGAYFGDLAVRLSDVGREDSRNRLNWSITGLIREDPLYDSKNVQKVMTYVKENGIHWSDPLYQELNEMITIYYQIKDPAEKAAQGKAVREMARMVYQQYTTDDEYRRDPEEDSEDN